ncbi:threonine--tRNA ligase [Tautonia plasticadhaerens]|uniref:Threonine--tRNA ligase n=1 Tax=Tautonia plasticadhaerens TaxID=2527974 RepID=A0A518GWL0_9BACT|nr:threonine--tRNA ligase [Tautonia plasticadhaerens]QDV32942.1 Threonine--tRNA ligase [Tautonia plasticadhaerens]
MVQIQLPDGSVKEFPEGVRPRDVAASIGKRLAEAAVAAVADGTVVDLDRPLEDGTGAPIAFRVLTPRDAEAIDVLRHSTAHVMARAVLRLFPDARLAFGPTTATGFYYDIDLPGSRTISEDDFPAIEAEMQKIVASAEPFERFTLPADDARQFCEDLGQQLKVEHIDQELHKFGILSFYRQGEFVDLCRGPHIPHAGKVGAFKLLSIAAAYWKGRTDGPMLQRLYGTAFFDRKDLDAYLTQIEEAKKRDHRKIGKELNLFTISERVGSGLILWMPKGAIVRGILEQFLKDELLKRGYEPVYTPHIGKIELYETSGHYPYYRDSQFPPFYAHPLAPWAELNRDRLDVKFRDLPMGVESEDMKREENILAHAEKLDEEFRAEALKHPDFPFERYHTGPISKVFELRRRYEFLDGWLVQQDQYLLKPMNCPHHIQIYAAQPRSYRDLPVRLAEFGTVYRYEQSGQLAGLTRVRGFTQDDAHLFCTPDQVRGEFRATMELTQYVLGSLGLHDYRVRLSKSDRDDPKFKGADFDVWERAEADIRSVLDEMGLRYEEAAGEAAFYGPKADFVVRDCLGRQWQLGTVQLDYVLPERFELEYTGADNTPHRPVMIHRAPFGSMERFMGILIEHFAGAFPLWLAPEQVRVLPISDKFVDYADRVLEELKAAGLRTSVDRRPEKVNARIRDAQLEKIPAMLVVGANEVEAGTVAFRDRIDGNLGSMPLAEAVARLRAEVDGRVIRQAAAPSPPEAVTPESEGEKHAY